MPAFLPRSLPKNLQALTELDRLSTKHITYQTVPGCYREAKKYLEVGKVAYLSMSLDWSGRGTAYIRRWPGHSGWRLAQDRQRSWPARG